MLVFDKPGGAADPLANREAGGSGQREGLAVQFVGQLEGFKTGNKGQVFACDLKVDLDGRTDLHARQIGDEDFFARVSFGGGIPAGVHDVDFAGGNLLAQAGLGYTTPRVSRAVSQAGL